MVERAKMNGPPTPAPAPQPHHEPTLPELEQALRIDTLDLMTADAEQPELFYRIAKMLAGLKAEHDNLKLALEEAKSRAQNALRSGRDVKPTVAEADAIVTLDPEVRKISQLATDVQGRVGKLLALKEAYTQRKSSLTDLVELQRQAGTPIDPAVVKDSLTEQRRSYRR